MLQFLNIQNVLDTEGLQVDIRPDLLVTPVNGVYDLLEDPVDARYPLLSVLAISDIKQAQFRLLPLWMPQSLIPKIGKNRVKPIVDMPVDIVLKVETSRERDRFSIQIC